MKDHSELSDEKLIRFYLSGNPAAMATLVDLYKDRIYTSILNMVQDKQIAEEIFNQVFAVLINDVLSGKTCDNDDFVQWAVSISHQLCIEYNRKQAVTFTSNQSHINFYNQPFNIQQANTSFATFTNHQSHTKIKTLISLLPEQQREVMALSHYAGLSFKEIAGIMKCSLTITLDIMQAGLNNLRKLLTEKEKMAA
jgi:RNA polymerase sigma factor (sigma-70 family)